MKIFFYMAVAAIAALSSCSDDNDAILGESGKQNEGGASFTATIESDASTRTTITDGTGTNKKVLWSDGDAVSINGVTYTTSLSSASETATFTTSGTEAQTIEGKYKAIYPTAYSSGTGSNIVYRLPAVHAYSDGFNMPMYAEGTTTDLAFKNLCGVLAVTVKNISGIKAVRVISTTEDVEAPKNTKLSGEFTVATSGDELVMTMGACNSNQVTINCGDGVDADANTGKVFYFPIPPALYDSLQVVVESGTNTVAHMTSGDSPLIARNRIYNITFDGTKHNGRNNVLPIYATTKPATGNPTTPVKCVTLWPGSPIFATINVGQTNPYSSSSTEYTTANVGDYFAWGETAPYYSSISGTTLTLKTGTPPHGNSADSYINGYSWKTYLGQEYSDPNTFPEWNPAPDEFYTLKPTYDAATENWGPIWRMPTKAEFGTIGTNTNITLCNGSTIKYNNCALVGIKMEGKNDFSNNGLFLPSAGYCSGGTASDQGTDFRYWTSSSQSDSSSRLNAYYNGGLSGNRYKGLSVRAVLR